MRIIADCREPADILAELGAAGSLSVEVEALDVGDYVIGPGVVVERKSGPDFVASILDGRLGEQSAKMKASYRQIVWILEGSPYEGVVHLDPRQITAAISRLIVVDGASLVRTETRTETVELLLSLTKRLQDGQHELALRPMKPQDPRALAEFIVSGLPGIGRGKARMLLEQFGSVRQVFTAGVEDIAATRGFGRKTAEAIRAALDSPYATSSPAASPRSRSDRADREAG